MVTLASALACIKSDPLAFFSEHLIDRLCLEHQHDWRSSPLDPAGTLSMFLQQILAGNVSLAQTCRIAGSRVTPQAYCQARKRLPLAVIHGLFDDLHARVIGPTPAEADRCHGQHTRWHGQHTRWHGQHTRCHGQHTRWHGHRVLLIDGSSFSMPDTPELRDHFGTASGQAPGCGFPVAHLLVLFCASTGLLLNVWASPRNTSDVGLADEAHMLLEAGDVLVGDDSFSGYPHIASLVSRGLHGVFPVHHLRIVDFRRGRPHSPEGKNAVKGMTRSKWIRSLGKCDQIVEYFKPKQCPPRMSREQFDALPESVLVREIRRQVCRPTGQRVTVTLVTTLLDAGKYPAGDLVKLRLSRWEVETDIGHLKTTMNLDVLRSQSVGGVLKEVSMIALVYNLVRVVMLEAASRQKVRVGRISFKDAYCWMRHARPGDRLPKLIVNPHRPQRIEPRCKKRRPKQYDLMNRPRAELRKTLLKQEKAA